MVDTVRLAKCSKTTFLKLESAGISNWANMDGVQGLDLPLLP